MEAQRPAPVLRTHAPGLTVLRPRGRVLGSPGGLPAEVLLLDHRIAVAAYPEGRSVQYESLEALLVDHGLVAGDLEAIERGRGLGGRGP